jgi:hypothetical protein
MASEIIVIEQTDWYESLVTDCRAIMTEAVFNSRWALIEGYHAMGKRIANETQLVWNARGNGQTLNDLSKSIEMSERRIYSAIQFYNKYPDINTLPQGKNISWNKIVTELLPETTPAPAEYCPACGRKMI